MTPADDKAPFTEQAFFLETVGHRIPAALTLPATGPVRGGVVVVPGSLFLDVDGNMPMMGRARPNGYLQLARQLAARGMAVVRYAKRGPGTGSEVVDPDEAERHRAFGSRVVVLEAALNALREHVPGGAPVVVAGHSEGAVVVTMAAAQGVDVRGVVLLSGPSVGIFGIMREQLPIPPGSPPDAYRAFDTVVEAMRRGGALPEVDASDPTLAPLSWVVRSGGEAAVRYMAQIDAMNPADTLTRVRQPVLIVQGGRDSSVLPHHARVLRAVRDAAGLPTESAFFPELTHLYKVGLDGMDPMELFLLETENDPAVADQMAAWVNRVLV